MNYFQFAREHRRFLSFGALLIFCSNLGQTFFISLFNAPIRETFTLSHGEFGSIYSMATLASGFSILWLGRKIDQTDLRAYSVLIAGGLVIATLMFASAANIAMLALALFALRLSGQGLMAHAAMTSMTRYFSAARGKAVSIVALGFPIGEAALPALSVLLMHIGQGWRGAWAIIALVLAAGFIPAVWWLLRNHHLRHAKLLEELNTQQHTQNADTQDLKQWTRHDVLRDLRFYMLLPSALAAPFILTGLFFHQVHLADSKNWSLSWLATCFIGYATANVISSLITGSLVDRFGAYRLMPYFLLPLLIGIAALSLGDAYFIALIYMICAGITTGASLNIVSATWAEIYGITHLGAIRGLTSSLMVFSTALAPVLVGGLLDAGVHVDQIVQMAFVFILVAITVQLPLARKHSHKA